MAFARGVHNGLDYALKFYVERSSFLAERDMYRSQTLGRLLPQVRLRRGLCLLVHVSKDLRMCRRWLVCMPTCKWGGA